MTNGTKPPIAGLIVDERSMLGGVIGSQRQDITPTQPAPVGQTPSQASQTGTGTTGQLTGGTVQTPSGAVSVGGGGGYAPRTGGGGTPAPAAPRGAMIGGEYVPPAKGYAEQDYVPGRDDPSQKQIYDVLENSLLDKQQGASTSLQNIQNAKTQYQQALEDFQSIRSAPQGSTFTVTVNGEEKDLNKNQAALQYIRYIASLRNMMKQEDKFVSYNTDLNEQLNTLRGYRNLGYEVKPGGGGYSFREPKATTVYSWKHEGIAGEVGLSAVQFLYSPLGIRTVGAGFQEYVLGQKGSLEAEKEKLASFGLGLEYGAKQRGAFDYFAQVTMSPAMIEGVYTPLALMGGGMLIGEAGGAIAGSEFGAGLSEKAGWALSRTGTLPSVGRGAIRGAEYLGTPGGQLTSAVALYGATEAPGLMETYQKEPEAVGAKAAESIFSFAFGYAAFGEGIKIGKTPPSEPYRPISGQPMLPGGRETGFEFEPGIQPPGLKQQRMIGQMEITAVPPAEGSGGTAFTGRGQFDILQKWRKPQTAFVEIVGTGETYPGVARIGADTLEMSSLEGTATIKTFGRKGWTLTEQTSIREVSGTGAKIGEIGEKIKLFETQDISGLRGGRITPVEPTTGTSMTLALETDEQLFGKNLMERYVSRGEYYNLGVKGESYITGKVYKAEVAEATKGLGEGADIISTGKTGATTATKIRMKPFDYGAVSQDVAQKVSQEFKPKPLSVGGLGEGGLFSATISEETKQTTRTLLGEEYTTARGQEQESGMETILISTPSMKQKEAEDIGITGIFPPMPKVKTREREGEDLGFGTKLDVSQDVAQEQKQQQQQQQKQEQLTDMFTQTISITTPRTPRPGYPHPPPPILGLKKEEDEYLTKPKLKKKEREFFGKKKSGDKGLLADILSVTESQARYGKATQPRLTKGLWKEAEKKMYLRVPTEEMMGKGERPIFTGNIFGKKNNKNKGGKNVYF